MATQNPEHEPKLATLSPKPQARSPKPEALSALSPKPEALNPKPYSEGLCAEPLPFPHEEKEEEPADGSQPLDTRCTRYMSGALV